MSVDHPPADRGDHRDGLPARSGSRQHKTNRAGRENPPQYAGEAHVTRRTGTKLRKEALEVLETGAIDAITWGELRTEWRSWYLDTESSKLVFEDEDGDLHAGDHVHSFTEQYQRRQCARAHQLESGLRDKWGSTLHTTMLTLTASTTDDDGYPRPPADHQADVLGSWPAVRRALKRQLDAEGIDWHRLGILEPHPQSGYTHVHVAVFTHGPVAESVFEPVIQAHLRNCPTAGKEAHEDAISVKVTGDRGLHSLGSYLTAYMAPNFGENPLEVPENVQLWYALQWATPTQRFRPDNGAQELMKYEDEDENEDEQAPLWRFIGIAPDGDLEEIHECSLTRNVWGETRPSPSSRAKPPP